MTTRFLRRLRGWRTLALQVAAALWGVAVAFDWQTVIDDRRTLGLIALAIAVVTALLRLDTRGPVGRAPE